MQTKLILFELNEVPFRVLDDYCARRPASCLARWLSQSAQYETFAEDRGHLSPWVTWPSLHRGVDDARHTITDFGQDLREIDRAYPPLWKLLSAAGVRTGVCGSLHSYAGLSPGSLADGQYAFYLPDTFAAGSECFPKRLEPFQAFNLAMARESARNVAPQVQWRLALDVLRAAPGLGLRPSTLLDVGGQLLAERLRPARRVRRRTYQALLAFDVFLRQLRATEPDFATFFTNHVASAMHRYWAAHFPGDYASFGLGQEWVATYRDEIDFALGRLDRCLARLLAFVDRRPEYALWVTTSMGQAATSAEPIETELHLKSVERLTEACGLTSDEWTRLPAMLPQVNLRIAETAVDRFRAALGQLRIAGEPVETHELPGGLFVLRFGQTNLAQRPDAVRFRGQAVDPAALGFENLRVDDRSGVTAYHVPQGALVVYQPGRPAAARGRTQISTLDVAPAILRAFGQSPPAYMRGTRTRLAA